MIGENLTSQSNANSGTLTEAQQYYIGLFERWQKMSTDPQVKIDNPELWEELSKLEQSYFFENFFLQKSFEIHFTNLNSNNEPIRVFRRFSCLNEFVNLFYYDKELGSIKLQNLDLNYLSKDTLKTLKQLTEDKRFKEESVINCTYTSQVDNIFLQNELDNFTSPVIKNEKGDIIIYQNPNGSIEVNLDNGQIWLRQSAIAQIFGIDRTVATKHINKIFRDDEVPKKSNVQKMHFSNSDKPVSLYSLDVVLGVGYKTNTKNAIKFRQWANTILKDYILKGYSINPDRLVEVKSDLRFLIENRNQLSNDIFDSIFAKYTESLITLNQFDENNITEPNDNHSIHIDLQESYKLITKTKQGLIELNEAWECFGKEIDNKLNSTVGALNQTYGGLPVYNRSQKLSNLLYLVVKNHCFVDGNKRIAAILFAYYCSKSLINIDPSNLTSLTLFVASSDPNDKDNLIKLIQTFIK